MTQRSAEEVGAGLNERRKAWLKGLPLTLFEWDWSERFSTRVVDYCVNQGLTTWRIPGDEPVRAIHELTPLGLAVRALITPPAEDEQP